MHTKGTVGNLINVKGKIESTTGNLFTVRKQLRYFRGQQQLLSAVMQQPYMNKQLN
jgi:hypothetical protein